MTCLDYAPKAIKLLKNNFVECDAIDEFDLLNKNWESQKNTLYLLNRVSTEFDDKQWEEIFYNVFNSNIEYICIIPTELLNIKIALKEKVRHILKKLLKKKMSFAGYMRTRDTFEGLWSKYYHNEFYIEKEGVHLFLLKKK